MPDTVIVTAKDGPGLTVTARTIPNVTNFNVRTVDKVLTVRDSNSKMFEFDINAVTTVTYTISGGNATITLS